MSRPGWLRMCLCMTLILTFCRRSRVAHTATGAWQLWQAKALWPKQVPASQAFALFLTAGIGGSLRLGPALGSAASFCCNLSFWGFIVFQLGFSSAGERALTTRQKPRNFTFCLESAQHWTAVVIIWLSLFGALGGGVPQGRLAFGGWMAWIWNRERQLKGVGCRSNTFCVRW